MDWYDDQAFQDEVKPGTDRVLTHTSGNAQSFSLDQKYDVDRHNLSSLGIPDLSFRRSVAKTTLYSNDRRAYVRQKFNSRRLRQRIRLAQAYLRHPKFLAFKSRARKDIDKTGATIWDEETERAFHNAIIHIPAMGRRKKSQKGKSLGRNELIVEWIKQETDKERTRKQISSHIQTLDNLFKAKPEDNFAGVDEWWQIRKESDDSTADSDGPEFYDNSIADMVRNWRSLQVDLTQLDFDVESALPPGASKASISDLEPDTLTSLHFEMWVSLSDKMDKALHRYTTVQSNISARIPEPLENIQGWRTSWPGLVPLIEDPASHEKFDIILLNANIKLMLDFPPTRSKLGIGLELDFNTLNTDSVLAGSNCWHCTTYIYQRGKMEAKAEHNGCHSPGPGRVKPPFESKWWAEQFTRLTEKRRHAMDSGNDAAVEAADEAAHIYLSDLKIMQQISKDTVVARLPGDTLIGDSIKPKRMAILLWSFSRTSSYFVGTTTWHKLIPPPQRLAMNSPVPTQDLALSSLNMDTTVDTALDKSNFGHQGIFSPYPLQSTGTSNKGRPRDELCQDDFLMDSQQNFASVSLSYDTVPEYSSANFEFHNQQAYEFNSQHLGKQRPDQFDILFDHVQQNVVSNDLFETHRHVQYPSGPPVVPSQRGYRHRTDVEIGREHERAQQAQMSELRRWSLMVFDATTHRALQQQLSYDHNSSSSTDILDTRQSSSAPPMQHHRHHRHHRHQQYQERAPHPLMSQTTVPVNTPEDESLRQALLAETYHHNPESQQQQQQQQQQQPPDHHHHHHHLPPSQDSINSPIPAPTAIRPPLQHRHTFAGVLHADDPDDVGSVNIDPPPHQHHNYIHFLDSLDPTHGEFLDVDVDPLLALHDQGISISVDAPIDLEVDRARSLPLPVLGGVGGDVDDMSGLDDGLGGSGGVDLHLDQDQGEDGDGDEGGGVEIEMGVGDGRSGERMDQELMEAGLGLEQQGEVEGEWVRVKVEGLEEGRV